jgi:hypothetical protein
MVHWWFLTYVMIDHWNKWSMVIETGHHRSFKQVLIETGHGYWLKHAITDCILLKCKLLIENEIVKRCIAISCFRIENYNILFCFYWLSKTDFLPFLYIFIGKLFNSIVFMMWFDNKYTNLKKFASKENTIYLSYWIV